MIQNIKTNFIEYNTDWIIDNFGFLEKRIRKSLQILNRI